MLSKKRLFEPVIGSNLEKVKEDVIKGIPIFLTGEAGSGKTYLINRLYEELSKDKKYTVYKTASTGIAAYGIEGTTINSFALVGVKCQHVYHGECLFEYMTALIIQRYWVLDLCHRGKHTAAVLDLLYLILP